MVPWLGLFYWQVTVGLKGPRETNKTHFEQPLVAGRGAGTGDCGSWPLLPLTPARASRNDAGPAPKLSPPAPGGQCLLGSLTQSRSSPLFQICLSSSKVAWKFIHPARTIQIFLEPLLCSRLQVETWDSGVDEKDVLSVFMGTLALKD